MLLALEIGNSTVAAGVFCGERLSRVWHAPTHEGVPARILHGWLDELAEPPGRGVLAGVVPAAVESWRQACARVLPTMVIGSLEVGLGTVGHPAPERIGVDRLLAARAAVERAGAPVIVVDCGTATTVDAVDAAGRFAGGAIMAGPALQRDALAGRTALLPAAELALPAAALGRDTASCLQSGLVLGHAEAVAGLARRMAAELGAPAAPVVGTGGGSELLAAAAPGLFAWRDPALVLRGLRLAAHTAREVGT